MLHRDSAECRRLRSPASQFQPTRAVQGPPTPSPTPLTLSFGSRSLLRVCLIYPRYQAATDRSSDRSARARAANLALLRMMHNYRNYVAPEHGTAT
jgi:hypothetical protein